MGTRRPCRREQVRRSLPVSCSKSNVITRVRAFGCDGPERRDIIEFYVLRFGPLDSRIVYLRHQECFGRLIGSVLVGTLVIWAFGLAMSPLGSVANDCNVTRRCGTRCIGSLIHRALEHIFVSCAESPISGAIPWLAEVQELYVGVASMNGRISKRQLCIG